MAKTVSPGLVQVTAGDEFAVNALPDPFDARDLLYRPRLEPLPRVLDRRPDRYVMRQQGNSCTGHAVAAAANAVLARAAELEARASGSAAGPAPHVSPYMLYALARRYDEFPGEDDVGSSLRGALKGWFHHGVLLEEDWPALDPRPEPDVDDDETVRRAGERPLGAFYRVDPFRLDDMQSAITELGAVCVSAVVHDGWRRPVVVSREGATMHVISRKVTSEAIGGHAFVLAGYNSLGFLVQNSWGPEWGDGGFATLPYEDWLQSAYDAWVCRPGVPNTPLAGGWSRVTEGTAGRLMTGAGPDVRRLRAHVVNLGNDGRLSTSGRFVSTPAQVEHAFGHMRSWHDFWRDTHGDAERHVVLYAHGGLNNEEQGLEQAEANLNWWLNNRIYPLFFAWQSGIGESLLGQLGDAVGGRLPAGLGFDLTEAADRLVEGVARRTSRWIWAEMKENARAASADQAGGGVRGGTFVADRLRAYADEDARDLIVHLVGHSAGAVFHAALLPRLRRAGVRVSSVSFLAPALRVAAFRDDVLPLLGDGTRFTLVNLSDRLELDDTCVNVYHKSLLYLVSRALEDGGAREVPLLGMTRSLAAAVDDDGRTPLQQIEAVGGTLVVSSSPAGPADRRSTSRTHGGFDDDGPTMTSVLLRMLRSQDLSAVHGYRRNMPLLESPPDLAAGEGPEPAAAQPTVAADVDSPGSSPLVETAEPADDLAAVPRQPGVRLEVADAPATGSPVLDHLRAEGWSVEAAGEER